MRILMAGDAAALARALRQVLTDDRLAHALGTAGAVSVPAEHAPETFAETYFLHYQSVL